jgi:hypothetical protein
VTQSSPTLTLSRSEWTPRSPSANTTVNVTSNTFWTVRSNEATPEEREDILRNFFAQVSGILGYTPRQPLAFHDLGDLIAGLYFRDTGQIMININFLQNSSISEMNTNREAAMRAVIHEARHEFQHNVVRDHRGFTVSLTTRNHWQNNINNYIDMYGGAAHFAQSIEWDAYNFEDNADRIREAIEKAGLGPEYEGSWPW